MVVWCVARRSCKAPRWLKGLDKSTRRLVTRMLKTTHPFLRHPIFFARSVSCLSSSRIAVCSSLSSSLSHAFLVLYFSLLFALCSFYPFSRFFLGLLALLSLWQVRYLVRALARALVHSPVPALVRVLVPV